MVTKAWTDHSPLYHNVGQQPCLDNSRYTVTHSIGHLHDVQRAGTHLSLPSAVAGSLRRLLRPHARHSRHTHIRLARTPARARRRRRRRHARRPSSSVETRPGRACVAPSTDESPPQPPGERERERGRGKEREREMVIEAARPCMSQQRMHLRLLR